MLPKHKFGYQVAVEKNAIRDRLASEGLSGIELHFAIETAYLEIHANDIPYREKRIATIPAQKIFTVDELEHLIRHFEGANDPTSVSIREKAKLLLKKDV